MLITQILVLLFLIYEVNLNPLLPGPPGYPSLRPTTLGLPTPLGPSLALLVRSNPSFLSIALTVSPPPTDGSKFDPSGDIKL